MTCCVFLFQVFSSKISTLDILPPSPLPHDKDGPDVGDGIKIKSSSVITFKLLQIPERVFVNGIAVCCLAVTSRTGSRVSVSPIKYAVFFFVCHRRNPRSPHEYIPFDIL